MELEVDSVDAGVSYGDIAIWVSSNNYDFFVILGNGGW